MRRRLPPVALLSVLAFALALVACGGPTARSDGALVVVSTSVLADVVSDIVGDEATVEVLVPPGSDPHDFEPSARQAASLRDADLVVVNGLGLEAGLRAALRSAIDDGATLVEVGSLIDALPFGSGHHRDADDDHGDQPDGHDADEGHHHDPGSPDPHFWHDPTRMAAAVPGLVEALVDAAPRLDTPALRARAEALVTTLLEVDAEVAAVLDEVPPERRLLVTNHDMFGYLAARYGFEVIGAVIPGGDTLARPGPGALAALVAEIERHDLPAVFADNVTATTLAEALVAEVGHEVRVVTLYTDALGEPGSGADTYPDMLRTNARLIADALSS